MGQTLRPRRGFRTLRGRKLVLLNVFLIVIPLAYLGYQPLLRYLGSMIISDSEPKRADAIVLLSGGEPGRAWGAADLYQGRFGAYVILTSEPVLPAAKQLREAGIEIASGLDNNMRILRGLGVPQERILRVEPAVEDTFDELVRVRELAAGKHWNSLVIVTSNYHTRRTRLTARYIFGPSWEITVVGSKHDDFDPGRWWRTRRDSRTFLIEFEKLVAYTLYIGPRLLWTSLRSTNSSSISSASPASF